MIFVLNRVVHVVVIKCLFEQVKHFESASKGSIQNIHIYQFFSFIFLQTRSSKKVSARSGSDTRWTNVSGILRHSYCFSIPSVRIVFDVRERCHRCTYSTRRIQNDHIFSKNKISLFRTLPEEGVHAVRSTELCRGSCVPSIRSSWNERAYSGRKICGTLCRNHVRLGPLYRQSRTPSRRGRHRYFDSCANSNQIPSRVYTIWYIYIYIYTYIYSKLWWN